MLKPNQHSRVAKSSERWGYKMSRVFKSVSVFVSRLFRREDNFKALLMADLGIKR
jgi:hypothetical protein